MQTTPNLPAERNVSGSVGVPFFLEESPGGSVRSIALRCGLELEKSRLSHQLCRMQGRGLITKTADAVVELTDKGRAPSRSAGAGHLGAGRRTRISVRRPLLPRTHPPSP
jgi:hypothetical protein